MEGSGVYDRTRFDSRIFEPKDWRIELLRS
jgi:hypothetical protein